MKAIILGINGQDGPYLAKLLLSKGYEVWGTSRDAQVSPHSNLSTFGIADKVRLISMAPNDFRSVLTALDRSDPDEIYNLAGQSSVGLSFDMPAETLESFVSATLNILESIRLRKKPVRFYNAGSSECFGDTNNLPADETTLFHPRSPYAVAKASAHWLVSNYREAYGLYACTGILFNHESSLRPARFVTQKIIQSAKRIANGSDEKLNLGCVNIHRDWGLAEEFVEAMWLMLQNSAPEDIVIATGKTYGLDAFVAEAFRVFGLEWNEHVVVNDSLKRPSDIAYSRANPTRARQSLGWEARSAMPEVVRIMAEGRLFA